MKDIFENWNRFLIEHQAPNPKRKTNDWNLDQLITEQLLAEGRLEDVKKKYQEHFPEDIINKLSRNDPSGNNKYLAHMVKMLLKYGKSYEKQARRRGARAPVYTLDQYNNTARNIGAAVRQFHELNKYVPAEQGGRDIHSYKTIEDLEQAVQNAKAVQAKKEAEKVHKEKIRADAERLYQDKTTLVVRPETEEASCYYGQGTKWCISATESRNYWDDYTREEGKAFVFILDKEADEKIADDYGKIALVYSQENMEASYPEEAYDAADDSVSGHEVLNDYEELWGTEKFGDIISAIQDNLYDDLPEDPFSLEGQVENIEMYANDALLALDPTGPERENISFPEIWAGHDEYGYPGIHVVAQIQYSFKLNPAGEELEDNEDIIIDEVREFLQNDISDSPIDTDSRSISGTTKLFSDIEVNWASEQKGNYGSPKLQVRVQLTCTDCHQGDSLEDRRSSVANAESFIDNIAEIFSDGYEDAHETLRLRLREIEALGPSKWDVVKQDMITDIHKLEHFQVLSPSKNIPTKLFFKMISRPNVLPPLGNTPSTQPGASEGMIMRAIFGAEKPAGLSDDPYWHSPQFTDNFMDAIKNYSDRAEEYATRQLKLPYGSDSDEEDNVGIRSFALDVDLRPFLVLAGLEKPNTKLALIVRLDKGSEDYEIASAIKYMQYLDKHYEDILEEARKVYNNIVARYEEKTLRADRKILDGTELKNLIRQIDSQILSEPEEVQANIVEFLKWFQDNFDKMREVEKRAAVEYLSYVQSRRSYNIAYLNDKDIPNYWNKYVRDQLNKLNAPGMTVSQYKWQGKRDEIVENIRQRVRTIISEHLKK